MLRDHLPTRRSESMATLDDLDASRHELRKLLVHLGVTLPTCARPGPASWSAAEACLPLAETGRTRRVDASAFAAAMRRAGAPRDVRHGRRRAERRRGGAVPLRLFGEPLHLVLAARWAPAYRGRTLTLRGWALTRPPPTQTVAAGAHSLAAALTAATLAAANLAAAACAADARAADARAADALAAASSERPSMCAILS